MNEILASDGHGTELIVELWDCSNGLLGDAGAVQEVLTQAAVASGAMVIESCFHVFEPDGVTGFLLLRESHIAIHTWPEINYAAVDIFTCGRADPHAALKAVCAGFAPRSTCVRELKRGVRGAVP